MQIGKLGRQSGLSRDTLRFYEKEGLLGKVPRLENGYRDYPPELKLRLTWISELKALGLSLSDIKALTSQQDKSPATHCDSLREPLKNRLQRLNEAIEELENLRSKVSLQLNECEVDGSELHCSSLNFCRDS